MKRLLKKTFARIAVGIDRQPNGADDHSGNIAPIVPVDPTEFRRIFVDDHDCRGGAGWRLGIFGRSSRSFDAHSARFQHRPQDVSCFRKFVHDEDPPSVLHVAILPWIAALFLGVGAENIGNAEMCQNQNSRRSGGLAG